MYRKTPDKLLQNTFLDKSPTELALGYLRYEVLRKLSPMDFYKLYKRNLVGENFDEMVDEMIDNFQ
ncbi:MAG: hypothetical protein Q7R95_11365 [bacterium]|nr:hypothetical protein [bacterium]